MLNLPYGISDFYKIRSEGYDYIDRTQYIPTVEDMGLHLVFLRPRRFGKSLWLSTLENYYDLAKAAEFDRLFGDLAVGQNPTPRRNSYFVLRWDFSLVSAQGEVAEIGQALHAHINARIQAFVQTYQQWLSYPVTILPENAIASFESLLATVNVSPHRLYLLIDEYDNFANEVLMSGVREGSERYKALLYGEGLLKTLFKAVKSGSSGLGLDRVFTTGVAPIVLSDLSSGYNISENITLRPRFSQLCGFTQAEVSALWTQVADECDLPAEARAEPLELMRTYYNGYCFNMEVSEPIYNPTLTLYFLKAFQEERAAPRELLDSNLAMDRGKIAYIAALPNSDPVLASAMDDEHPPVIDALARSFGVEDVLYRAKDESFMVSLLYYFGVLTLDGITEMAELRFRVPNLVIRSLYAEQLRRHMLPPDEQRTASDAARALFHHGELQPLCEFIETTYFRALDNRDYRWANELTVKIAFLTLLFNDRFYIVDADVTTICRAAPHAPPGGRRARGNLVPSRTLASDSEPYLERSYADLTLLVRPDMRHYALQDALLEFKYLPLSDLGLSGEAVKTTPRADLAAMPLVQSRLAEATRKAEEYRATLQSAYNHTLRLHTYVIVALGFERLVWVKV